MLYSSLSFSTFLVPALFAKGRYSLLTLEISTKATEALRPILLVKELIPGPNITDGLLPDWVRGHVQTVYHASCTCKMGVASDPMAVLDSEARVRGVRVLRVVDASSFPLLVPGHPQSTICECYVLLIFCFGVKCANVNV